MNIRPLPAAPVTGGRYERDPVSGDLRRVPDAPAEAGIGPSPDATGSNADPSPVPDMEG